MLEIFTVSTTAQSVYLQQSNSSSDTENVIIEFYMYLIAVFLFFLISIGIIMLIKYR